MIAIPALRRFIPVLLLLWISTGCYVPVVMQVPGSRQYYPATREDFSIGVTRRADVLLKMGEPDELFPDDSRLIYRWEESRGAVTFTGCDVTELSEATTFIFAFDEEGVLKSLNVAYDE